MNTKQPWITEQNELLLSLYHTFKYPSGQMNWDRCFGSTDNNDVKLGNRTLTAYSIQLGKLLKKQNTERRKGPIGIPPKTVECSEETLKQLIEDTVLELADNPFIHWDVIWTKVCQNHHCPEHSINREQLINRLHKAWQEFVCNGRVVETEVPFEVRVPMSAEESLAQIPTPKLLAVAMERFSAELLKLQIAPPACVSVTPPKNVQPNTVKPEKLRVLVLGSLAVQEQVIRARMVDKPVDVVCYETEKARAIHNWPKADLCLVLRHVGHDISHRAVKMVWCRERSHLEWTDSDRSPS